MPSLLLHRRELPTRRRPGRRPALEDEPQDDLQEEFLGALGALGGSAGNGRLREVLEWEEASFDGVKAQLLSRGLIVPARGGAVRWPWPRRPGHGRYLCV